MGKGSWLLSKKIRVTPELVEKAKKIFEEVFEKTKKKTIIANKGLSRGELRALERKGYVRKMIVFGDRRYTDSTGSQQYVWSWIGDG